LGEGKLGSHLTQFGEGRAYLRAKFHLDPSNRLATVHQRHRQTDSLQTDRQTDRTTVGQKLLDHADCVDETDHCLYTTCYPVNASA